MDRAADGRDAEAVSATPAIARSSYYPYGFLADNAESQLEGQIFAEARPELRVRFVPCLNGSASLGELIAKQIAALETDASLPAPHQVPA